MNNESPPTTKSAAAAKATWIRYFLVQAAAITVGFALGFTALLVGSVYLIAAVTVFFNLQYAREVTPVLLLLGAFVGAIVFVLLLRRRIARAWGMVCRVCGREFNQAAYEFLVVRGECSHCLRQKQAHEAVAARHTTIAPAEDSSNPYAPPQTEFVPAPSPPQRVFRVTGWRSYLHMGLALFITGWIGLFRLVWQWRKFDQLDYGDGPKWLTSVVEDLHRLVFRIRIGIGVIWLAVFVTGMTAKLLLFPQTDIVKYLLASHFICGFATAVAVLPFLHFPTQKQRDEGVAAPYWPQTKACEALLFPFGTWRETPAAAQFRTQGPEGILLTVRHMLTAEVLLEATHARTNADGWTVFLLPLDAAVFANYADEELEVKVRSLDNKPWLVRYERTPTTS